MSAFATLFEALKAVDGCYLVTDAINGQKMWLTHQSVVDMVRRAIAIGEQELGPCLRRGADTQAEE